MLRSRWFEKAGWTVVLVASIGCAPRVSQVSADRYRLNCETGIDECRRLATHQCPAGYNVIEAASAVTGASLLVQCRQRREERWTERTAPTAQPAPPPCPPAIPAGVECVRNFQCSQPGAQCIDGKCVAPAAIVQADPTDRCVVGAAGAPDPAPLFPTASAIGEYLAAQRPSKAAELALVTRLGGTWVDPGVRCKTLEHADRGLRRVQLLSGPLAGREGWLSFTGTPPAATPADASAPAAPAPAAPAPAAPAPAAPAPTARPAATPPAVARPDAGAP